MAAVRSTDTNPSLSLTPDIVDLSRFELPNRPEAPRAPGSVARRLHDGALAIVPFLAMLLPPGEAPAKVEPQPPARNLRIDGPTVLASVEDAIGLAQQKRISGPVREIENTITGTFNYELPVGSGRAHLRGIRAGEERNRLLTALAASGTTVAPESFPPTGPSTSERGGFFDNINVGTVLTGHRTRHGDRSRSSPPSPPRGA